MNKQKKVLMIYIEPTHYIVGLIERLLPLWQGHLDVIFLTENLTQQWNIQQLKWQVLPKNRLAQFTTIMHLMRKGHYNMVHLAGWGERLCLLSIFLAKLLGISVTIESDTPLLPQASLIKRSIKRLIYPILFSMVDLFLPGGSRQAQYIQHYAVPK